MLFNSYDFIFIFLPLTFIGTFVIGRFSHYLAAMWLACASLVFYGIWNYHFLALLIGSMIFNYSAGCWLGRMRALKRSFAKSIFITLIVSNIGVLIFYKYTNFLVSLSNQLSGSNIPALDIVLPLGISFFTFTQIAYLVDVYQGHSREESLVNYLLFVTYFPHLIAGPILHHKQMMPQFAHAETYKIKAEHIAVGLTIFVLGLAKKVLIADPLSIYANDMFNAVRDGQVIMLVEAWVGVLAYALQLYFDFSGYSDMAIGISLMFNIRLPLNFDSPYKSTSIIEFWRRWHISLSIFLRDYIYIPLGGNRSGSLHKNINVMTTMLIGGLWHGAGLNFLLWGALHGMYLIINHSWRAIKPRFNLQKESNFLNIIYGLITFVAVLIGWVFFRADSLSSAQAVLLAMVGENGLMRKFVPVREALKLIIPGLLIVWIMPNVQQIMRRSNPTLTMGDRCDADITKKSPINLIIWGPAKSVAVAMSFLFIWTVNSLSNVSEFLYFQF